MMLYHLGHCPPIQAGSVGDNLHLFDLCQCLLMDLWLTNKEMLAAFNFLIRAVGISPQARFCPVFVDLLSWPIL